MLNSRGFFLLMYNKEIIPHLFRTEYTKIVSVLCKLFGIEDIDLAEDLASETFLVATEVWGLKGIPENPTAWLYAVAKNKARDYFRRNAIFKQKIIHHLSNQANDDIEIDLTEKNITDTQLQMMFAICNPILSQEEQIGLTLRILCGFGLAEIANAFLSNKETIKKRLQRAKEKLKASNVKIEVPDALRIKETLDTVLTSLYLLYNEGYYSSHPDKVISKDLCLEALRLTYFLTQFKDTDLPEVNALLALMCFHSSRLEARIDNEGHTILYHDQDNENWDKALIDKGNSYLKKSSTGDNISKYHIEAFIAYWHTFQEDSDEKWQNILRLYNLLLFKEYSPIIALNRTYALAKANGKVAAIVEAEKLNLNDNYLYHSLLGTLYTDIDNEVAIAHFKKASSLASTLESKSIIEQKIKVTERSNQ